MINLTVLTQNGAPAPGAPSATFDEMGGTIGRADTNHLVLPDPDRAISRVHAQVIYRNGGYAIVDRGSNPITVNGQAVGSGREMPIAPCDRIQIGSFVLEARAQSSPPGAAIDDPFADLLGTSAAGSRSPAAARGGLIDPLASLGAGAAPPPAPPAARSASPAAAGGIPDDWDPFAPAAPAATGARDFAQSLGAPADRGQFGLDGAAAAREALVPGLSAKVSRDESLDALFGLAPGAGGGDPFADSLFAAPMAAPNMAAHQDPMKSLDSAPRASAESRADDLPDLHQPFSPAAVDRASPPAAGHRPAPAGRPAAPSTAPDPQAAPDAPPAPAAQAVPVFSWDASAGDGRTVIRAALPAAAGSAAPAAPVRSPAPAERLGAMDPPAGRPATAAGLPPPVRSAEASAAPVAARLAPDAPATPDPAPTRASPAPAGSAGGEELLAAFRDGLGVPNLKLEELTPDLMRLVGQLLRESAQGTVDLLVARAALKREVRAEATMIVAQKNNPLKFSPSAEAALQHLLSPPLRGFMDPAPAMRDAFDDLRAHQFGFVAGMRAALAGVLERFKPSELEGRLDHRSGLRSLLPGSRKAAMWEVFTEHYANISAEAEDDFHSLFGKAFLKAYEEHIAQLSRSRE